jgi:hypothetical protein
MALAFQLPKNLPLNDPVACAKLLERIEFEEFKAEKRIEKEWEGNKLLYLPRPLEWHLAEGTGYKGPNPKQQLILEAWKDRSIKVFTFTGGNRSGKTAIEVWMAFSVMFGEFIWSGEKLWFPHNKPRKVRLIGQDWEKHIKAVVEPELKKWWPQVRKVTTKKNNSGPFPPVQFLSGKVMIMGMWLTKYTQVSMPHWIFAVVARKCLVSPETTLRIGMKMKA